MELSLPVVFVSQPNTLNGSALTRIRWLSLRPRKYGVTSQRQSEAANLSTHHHNVTAEPSRTARGGRTITRGRTFQKGNGNRGDKGRNVPTGFGVYVAPSGATIINNPGQASPTILSTGTTSANYAYPFSSQATRNSSMNNQSHD